MTERANIPQIRFAGFTDPWEQRKLGDVASVYDGVHQTPDYKDGGVMFLSVENIATLMSNKFISEEAFERDYPVCPGRGDVLMTRIGDIGTSHVVETDDKLAFYVSLALLKPFDIDSYFLDKSLQSPSAKDELFKRTLHIAFPKKINKNQIAEVILPVPPNAEEQRQIGAFFSQLDCLITLHQRERATRLCFEIGASLMCDNSSKCMQCLRKGLPIMPSAQNPFSIFDDAKSVVADFAQAASGAANDAAEAVQTTIDDAAKARQERRQVKLDSDPRPAIDHIAPSPVLDALEEQEFDVLTERFKRYEEPGMLAKLGGQVGKFIPGQVKDTVAQAADAVQAQKLYEDAMKVVADGFKVVEEQAARFSVDDTTVLADINKTREGSKVTSLDEVCLLRSYEVSKTVFSQKGGHLGLALAEGAATGAPGFAGIPFNLVLSTFLFYRAVQSTAMYYGYDAKNDPGELVIAGEVFMAAMSPGEQQVGGIGAAIGKVMVMSEVTTVKQVVKKGWTAMASRGGVPLALAQMRALANAAARKAVANAGKKSLENSAFRNVFEQIGRKLSQKAIGKAIPVVGGVIGALFDTGQMNAILDYADLFYHKRFLLEKEYRIGVLLGEIDPEIVIEDCEDNEG